MEVRDRKRERYLKISTVEVTRKVWYNKEGEVFLYYVVILNFSLESSDFV